MDNFLILNTYIYYNPLFFDIKLKKIEKKIIINNFTFLLVVLFNCSAIKRILHIFENTYIIVYMK